MKIKYNADNTYTITANPRDIRILTECAYYGHLHYCNRYMEVKENPQNSPGFVEFCESMTDSIAEIWTALENAYKA